MTLHMSNVTLRKSALGQPVANRRDEDAFEPYFDRADIANPPKHKAAWGEPIGALEQMYAYYEA